MSLFAELKRRNVIRMAGLYLVGAWLIVQVAGSLLPVFGAPGMAFQMAEVRAWRGEKDQAFAWLDQAYAAHDGGLVRLPWDPAMDPLRDDPRFAALIKKMGFPK